jgi:ABC-type branched-subunit amino acid transport system permease subunit
MTTSAICILWITLLSFAAAYLAGDRFVVVSIAANYAVYMLFIARFGEGVRDLPGASSNEDRITLVSLMLLISVALALYVAGLGKSRLNAYLLIARDQPWVLYASQAPVKAQIFWIHFASSIPVCIAGVVSAAFYRAYSPNMHSVSLSLLLFIVGIPFGIDSLKGATSAALFFVSLRRFVDLLFSSSIADRAYQAWMRNSAVTASSLSAPFSEALLALLMLILIKLKPQGLFGTQTRWIRR